MRRRCDVLVIGAGPAGSSAALAAAAAGAEVVVFDRRRAVGEPARCAGFVPVPALRLPDFPKDLIEQRIDTMLTFTSDGKCQASSSPGFIVRRELLDRSLADHAQMAGARVITGARARWRHQKATVANMASGFVEIEAAVTIGADGPTSIAGGWLGVRNERFIAAAQWTVELSEPSSNIHVYFDQKFPGGYGWLFPRGTKASVGVGLDRRARVKPGPALASFAKRLAGEGLIKAKPLSVTGGLIPAGGPLRGGNGELLLVGDAAGLCHPLTGAGIAPAMLSGRLAGEAAAAAAGGDPRALASCVKETEALMGPSFREAVASRWRLYVAASGSQSDYCRAVRQEWIAFRPVNPSVTR